VTDEVGCGPDLVHHGRNGFIYPVGDCDRLAEHLLTLMLDPALRAAMGRHSLEIISTWSFDQDCEGLRAVLARMQGEPTRRA
jgi:glycosyltransferase involved in cell wall biosynthesis